MTCVWTPDQDTLDENGWSEYDPDQQERALLLASSSLVALTYGRVGACPITIRPCSEPAPVCGCWPNPTLWEGVWYNQCQHRTVCKATSEYAIPGPVGYISSFKIDGTDQITDDADFYTNWRLDDGHILVWQGEGTSPLPSTQDLDKPDTEAGTWSITYSRSYPVLKDGEIAVAFLALEFAKGIKPKGKCALPRGVTNVVRNGVSFTVQAGLFPGGLTNIDATDQFILKWVPLGMPSQRAQVFDPLKNFTNPARRTNTVPRKAV